MAILWMYFVFLKRSRDCSEIRGLWYFSMGSKKRKSTIIKSSQNEVCLLHFDLDLDPQLAIEKHNQRTRCSNRRRQIMNFYRHLQQRVHLHQLQIHSLPQTIHLNLIKSHVDSHSHQGNTFSYSS